LNASSLVIGLDPTLASAAFGGIVGKGRQSKDTAGFNTASMILKQLRPPKKMVQR
jgi:hypothetical protein